MSVGGTLLWPAVAMLAFLALTGVVVALGTSSTARYEFERNGAREQQRAAGAPKSGTHPAGRRSRNGSAAAAEEAPGPGAQGIGVAVRPAEAPAADAPEVAGWWLVGDGGPQVVAGPFPDRVDAEFAALASGLDASARYGAPRADGALVRRPSPEEQVWLTELGHQLDRLPEDWNALLTDTDPLTTLVVEVAAALVEAGLPVHDSARQSPSGGVCLTPAPEQCGVVVSWRPHDRMSLLQVRGAEVDADVQYLMNAAVADVLERVGFVVGPFGETGSALVTAIRP